MESLINITGIKPWNWLNSFFGASYGLYETNFVRRSYNEQVAAPARAPVLGGSITERSQTRQKNRKTKKTKKSFVVANR
jgi:hypothetical protein